MRKEKIFHTETDKKLNFQFMQPYLYLSHYSLHKQLKNNNKNIINLRYCQVGYVVKRCSNLTSMNLKEEAY